MLRSSSPTAAAPAAAPPPWPAPPEQQQQAGASARRALAAVLLCVLVPTLVIVASVATVGGGSASPGAAAGLGGGSLVVPLPPAAMSWPFADSLAEFAAGQPVLSSAGPVAFGAGPYPGTRALVLNNTAGVDVWTWASYLAAPAAAPLATARGFSFSVWASAAAAGGPTQGGVYLDLYDTAGRSYNFLGAGAGYWASNGASLAFGAAAARGGAPGTWFLSSGTYSTLGLDVYLDLYLNGTAAGRWTVAAGFTVAAVRGGWCGVVWGGVGCIPDTRSWTRARPTRSISHRPPPFPSPPPR